ERLGVAPAKVTTIGVAVGAEFVPTLLADVARARYRLGGSYVLFVGNFMPHKNLEGLLRAWASLPPTLRAAHRLVLAGGDAGRRPSRGCSSSPSTARRSAGAGAGAPPTSRPRALPAACWTSSRPSPARR